MEFGSQHPHVAIFPTPGIGHLIPLAELAKLLVLQQGFTATLINTADSSSKAHQDLLASLPIGITSIVLPPVSFDDHPDGVPPMTRIALTVLRSLPALRDTIKSLKKTARLVAFITDLFGTDAFEIAKEFNVPPFLFFPSNLMTLSFMLHLPALDKTTSCEYRDLPEPVALPGCLAIAGRDLLEPVQDRKDDAYEWFLHFAKGYTEAAGILVNSFKDMEPGAAEVMESKEPGRPPVYSIGPLVQSGSAGVADGSGWLTWLDRQPPGSVLFISFGSVGILTSENMTELALGIEISGARFLWVVRRPSGTADASYSSVNSVEDPGEFMPEGFLERTKGVGLLVPSWIPQVRVLSHSSTAGFLTHCGWNSILESVLQGLPMIAWPLYAEQRMNAVMLTEGVGVAIRPEVGKDGVVTRWEIARVVKELMEGKGGRAVKERVQELQKKGSKALTEEGSSCKTLAKITKEWKDSGTLLSRPPAGQ